jgi:hypothetical protein
VYSTPVPPPQNRRPVVIGGVVSAVVALALGAGGFVVYDRNDGAPQATTTKQARAGEPRAADAGAQAALPRAAPRLFTLAPQACVIVSPETVDRLVPSATIARGGGPTASTCDYSGKAGSRYRELRIETQIFAPAVSPDPVDDAKAAIGNRWADAREDPVVRTVDLRHVSGLGDEAYQRYATDKGQPTVVGEVVVRVRNSLAAVSYVENAPAAGRGDAVRQRCLSEATAVAQEILRAFQ